jgi:hypothetical protein
MASVLKRVLVGKPIASDRTVTATYSYRADA